MKKYTLEQFEKKYKDKRHISCGITFTDGERITLMNCSYCQIKSVIKKEVKYIASK